MRAAARIALSLALLTGAVAAISVSVSTAFARFRSARAEQRSPVPQIPTATASKEVVPPVRTQPSVAAQTRGASSVPKASTASAEREKDAFDDVLTTLVSRKDIKSLDKAKQIADLVESGGVSPERVRRSLRERPDAQGVLFHAMLTSKAMHRVHHRPGPSPFPDLVGDAIEIAMETNDESVRATILMNITTSEVTYHDGLRIADAAEYFLFTSRQRRVTSGAIHALSQLAVRRDEFDMRVAAAFFDQALRDDSGASFGDLLRALHGVSRSDFEMVVKAAPQKLVQLHANLIEELRKKPMPAPKTGR